MATVTTDARSNLYGSAVLLNSGTLDMNLVFAEDGCPGTPLGHNENDRSKGFAYELTPNGQATPGHQLWFGATRSGKGVSGIIPALLTTQSSVVAIDPKGELAWITAPRRRQLGQRVVILDPWNQVNERYGSQVGVTETVTRFNPLSALDPTSKDFNDDVSAIADALIVVAADQQSHWTDSARELIAGLIAAAVEADPGKASLRDVRQLLLMEDQELVRHLDEIRRSMPNSLAARKLRRFAKANQPEENLPPTVKALASTEIGSIRSTAETQTAILDSEALLDAMETDEPPFDLTELATGQVTLYCVLPPDKLSTHGRWLRMILTLSLRMIARQRKPPELPVLFILDEMGTIGPLRMIEDSYGLLAGLGVRIAGYLQDLSQLVRDYPKSWETFISNSSVVGLLQCSDKTTAEYFSSYMGNGTIEVNQGMSKHVRPTGLTGTKAETKARRNQEIRTNMANMGLQITGSAGMDRFSQEVWEPDLAFHPRPVLFPWEVRQSPADSVLLILAGRYNMRLKRYFYYSDPVMSKWARHDPNKPAPVIETAPPPPPVGEPPARQQVSGAQAAADTAAAAAQKFGKWLGSKLKQ